MSDAAGVKASSYAGPMAQAVGAGGAPGLGTIRRPVSNVAIDEAMDTNTLNDGRVVVPLAGKYIDIQNEDPVNAVEVAFAAAAGTVLVYGQQGTFAAGSAVAGWRIQPGQTISVIVPSNATRFCAVLGAAGPSTVALRCSELVVKG